MKLEGVKKVLYRQKPIATFSKISHGILYYTCTIDEGEEEERDVNFEIPINEVGNSEFDCDMPAQLLIRWINYED